MKLVALAGGVGGAKLANGLAQILPPKDLTIVVNTGDDFEHLGLYICPDLDTVCYTLAALANPETGWGRAEETHHALENIEKLGGENWFRLGDKDLATHIERSRRLREGQSLSRITRDLCRAWGVRPVILPMSDDPVRTIVDTLEYGELPFQEYFVQRKCEPKVTGFRFAGIEEAKPAPGVIEAISAADAIVICPSNPWVSINPILAVLQLRSTVHRPPSIVAISPIIGGQTVKGPAAKMFAELGIPPSALAVAEHYKNLLTGFILDHVDATLAPNVEHLNVQTCVTSTLMKTVSDQRQLAEDVLNFIQRLI
ncbi:MAG: 2-phospho-L-lactate transferase [Anaerolineales bacterium]|nr:2-phospho-L-lactate transferase [Anaerolineales bacterium]